MPGVILSATQQAFYYQQSLINNNNNNNNNNRQFVEKSNSKKIPYIPPEIIRIVLGLLKDDKKTLSACALVSHTFNLHVTPFLYHTVSFSYPYTFTLFANATVGESPRSRMIRHLDLSGFSTLGLQKSNAAIQTVVTPEILIRILRSCTMLEAFSVSETLESSITFEVLQVLTLECKNIRSLDFCGLSSKQFGSALASLGDVLGRVKVFQYYENDQSEYSSYSFQKVPRAILPRLQRLSLHECPIISEHSTILTLLAHAPNLTHLDLGGASISDMTLDFLVTETNVTKTLTHLLFARCKNISSDAITYFVTRCENLKVLNLYGDRDIATAISEYDLISILTSPVAKKFQTLDIGSSHITPRVLYAIQENCNPNLRHLGIAKAQIPSTLHLNEFLTSMPNLQYIDLTSVSCLTPLYTNNILNNLPTHHSLHTIEMSESLIKKFGAVNVNGWKVNKIKENYSRRCYYAKQSHGGRPDRVHPRKLDVAESGSERMSKIFKYYCFDV